MSNNALEELILSVFDNKIDRNDTLKLTKQVKELAKKMFFDKKLPILEEFLLNSAHLDQLINIAENYMGKEVYYMTTRDFIISFQDKVAKHIHTNELPKNRQTLLNLLGYGHISDFLSMFT
ncbi:MAG: hypothetical protein MUE53_01980 [Chitinophagales bacterium]|jgi:hypothetical protein|nr:hypothetical protein [Chitinophagales bacterium]